MWLQGQPSKHMISEIACRVPSGDGIGLAVPIPGMGGGGSSGGGNEVVENHLAQPRQFDKSYYRFKLKRPNSGIVASVPITYTTLMILPHGMFLNFFF